MSTGSTNTRQTFSSTSKKLTAKGKKKMHC